MSHPKFLQFYVRPFPFRYHFFFIKLVYIVASGIHIFHCFPYFSRRRHCALIRITLVAATTVGSTDFLFPSSSSPNAIPHAPPLPPIYVRITPLYVAA
jgi:hypothetical protein